MSSSLGSRRVVITGLGVISPIGNNRTALWESLSTGRSGVTPWTSLPAGALPMPFAAEAREFGGGIEDFGPLEGDQKKAVRKGLKVMSRECLMGVAAAQQALFDAGLSVGKYDPERAGIVFGSDYMLSQPEEFNSSIAECAPEGRFEFSRWGQLGMPKMNPLWLLKYLPNMPASHIAIYNDLRGPNNSITMREAASNLAVAEAFRAITRNHADLMLAGATGTRLHPMKAIHAVLCEELATEGPPDRAMRPFDLHRSGMVLGEGAGTIVMEELNSARARGATIYAEVLGAGSSAVADRNLVARRGAALINAMRATLKDAGVGADQVGHVQAHGLGTRSCDAEEAQAVAEVFGPRARALPVTAAKSYFGNLGAASGLVELVAGTLALKNKRLFTTLNFETPDPSCPLAVVNVPGINPGANFLNVNVTPQGQASCVLIGQLDAP